MKGLIRCADGSEVLETQMEDAIRSTEKLEEQQDALGTMAQAAAMQYQRITNNGYIPPSGARIAPKDHLTGAVYDAQEMIKANEAAKREKYAIKGLAVAVAGDPEFICTKTVWATLDKVKSRIEDKYAQPMILFHKGNTKGIDLIAARWAKNRKSTRFHSHPISEPMQVQPSSERMTKCSIQRTKLQVS